MPFGPAAVAAAVLLLAPVQPASSQAMREVRALPDDCRALLAQADRGTIAPWQRFVWMEHCDRIKRLVRLSSLLPPDEQPRFYEGLVPASRLPPGFDTAMPVLRVVFPERTFFDTGRAELRGEIDAVLAIVADSLRHEPSDIALFVAGHADARGARGLNERLSMDRADSLARRIFRAGVNFNSIWRVGFGSDMPLVSGNGAYAWDRNRRVEFLFAARAEAVGVWLADQQVADLCQARTAAEVGACRARLQLRTDYEAKEVSPPRRRPAEVAPSPDHPKQVTPGRSERQAVVIAGSGASIAVDLTTGTRRIFINPNPRPVPQVHVAL